jgi:hypothetical protein
LVVVVLVAMLLVLGEVLFTPDRVGSGVAQEVNSGTQ